MGSRTFVVNASPLILLARIRRLDLLAALAARVLIPQSVLGEVAAGKDRDEAAMSLRTFSKATVIPDIAVPERVQLWDLGAGESQVLAHALARPSAEAVLDDRAARRCARVVGVPYLGTLGVVLASRQAGHIPAARPVLEALLAQGIRLSAEVMEAGLREVGE